MASADSKVWLITGSSRGLGRALAEAVLEDGHRLVASARNPTRLDALCERFGSHVHPFTHDVTDPRAADLAIKAAVVAYGRLDVVVNNAGYGDIGSVEDTSVEEIRAQIETNLFGTIYTTKAAIPLMRMQGSGHIVQFSSVGGRIGATGRAAYSAAKWGVEGFSEALAKEVAPLGIKVTIVEPGGFRTDFAGASTKLRAARPEYESTVGAASRYQRDYNGNQPGDPNKAAKVLLKIVELPDPPLRLPLGSDAVQAIERADLGKFEMDRKWRALSLSTDY
ncbi:MAG TPA: SDR family NAD(P)-dependent oxidoreductase [Bauldia sp.]|nr:SDR family NAD(P)-dependent oxidoreductase [Bauldia sp.]